MNMLVILNSQSRKKEEFKPLSPDGRTVRMYTCGPTVYDSLHLGHARAAITPDVVRRYLEYRGYEVRYVMNFTDVDDKIIKRAIGENRDWRALTKVYIEEFHRLMLALNVRAADAFPRATDHVPEMISIVERLLKTGHAYVASDGDIYFDTSKYARYGALSGRKLEEEEAGLSGRITQARLAVKKNQGDFVLWKLNKNDRDEIAKGGDAVPRWKSPWGDGRPGWHLECSAMSRKYLDVPFDIHCGGQDLLFPHHEDEKAQTECAYHEELHEGESVRYWVHNAFVNAKARPEDAQLGADVYDAATNSVKQGKSLGNVKWLREVIWPDGPYDPMVVRMMLISSHYRSPIVFEPGLLDEANARLERIYNTLETLERAGPAAHTDVVAVVRDNFIAAMDDDFNTAGALGVLFEYVSATNQEMAKISKSPDLAAQAITTIRTLLNVLGIRPQRAKIGGAGDSEKLTELLLQVRQDVRVAKQYPISDKIRDGLKALGYEVEDLPGGKSVAKKKQ
jgi:cysteinyl-tRNA synthetase